MYTGTLIKDLMATVERAELRAGQRVEHSEEQKRVEEELRAIFAMEIPVQIPITEGEHVFVGAA
jgi:hypothetical protein